MVVLYILGGLLAIGGLIFGVIKLNQFYNRKFNYNLTNLLSVVLLAIAVILAIVSLYISVKVGNGTYELNSLILLILACIAYVINLIVNIVKTNIVFGLIATIYQSLAIFIILIIFFISISGSSQKRKRDIFTKNSDGKVEKIGEIQD